MPTSRHICIVAPEFIGPYPNGGVGTACYWEAMSLANAGFPLTVLYTGPSERLSARHWEEHFAATARFEYVDLARWAETSGADHDLGAWSPPFPEARTSELVLKFLRTRQFALVLVQEFQGHGLRALQARQSGDALAGVPIVVTLHGSRQWTCEGMQRLPIAPDMAVDFLEKESTRLADAVIAPSSSMAQWVKSCWGVEAPTVIPYCYDQSAARLRTAVHHEGPFTHLVFFGRLETRKGVQLLVRALAESPLLRHAIDRVTFLGKHARIEGIPSEQFLQSELASLSPIRAEVISDKGSHEALAWLRSQSHVLAVSPSLGDNLPYALLEMYTHRIPFVTTRVGGIPEIVGERNAHVLAEPTVDGLRATLEAICREGRLTIDYRDGYDVSTATRNHVEFVARLLDRPVRHARVASTTSLRVVVTDVTIAEDVAAVRNACCLAEPGLADAEWLSLNEWHATQGNTDTLFLHSSVRPVTGMLAGLRGALANADNDLVTSFYRESPSDEVIAPLGGAIDVGWYRNVFGGPCFLARSSAVALLREGTERAFDFWTAYAAATCSEMTLAMVPTPLYSCETWHTATTPSQIESVIREYHTRRPASLDLRWILKGAYVGAHGMPAASSVTSPGTAATGRALYDRLTNIPDGELRGFAELDAHLVATDPFFHDFAALRERLAPVLRRFEETQPRAYVYGAGQHTRMLLAAFPALGRFIDGFIDRQGGGEFLGKRCVSPDAFRAEWADVIVYSSREWERDMYRRMQSTRVEHVLLYSDEISAPVADTATRVQNRFGRDQVDSTPVSALVPRRPAWLKGAISDGDSRFLFHMIHALAPRRVLELGVASGCSSAALLCAMDALPDVAGGRTLSSFDVLDRCYFDSQYATGEAARLMYPRPHTEWRLNTQAMDARAVARTHGPGAFDFAFIDANHCHPWPLLDVLHLSAVLAPESWIVLHDIELPNLYPACPDRGALLLFQHWPFARIHGLGDSRNIGAVQLPARPGDLARMAHDLVQYEWQWPVHEAFMELPEVFADVAHALRARLEETHAHGAVRRLAAV